MVSTEKVHRSGQSIFFTNYWQKHFNKFLLLDLQRNYFMSILMMCNAKKQVAKFLTTPFLKEKLRTTASEIHTISFLRIFFVSLDKSVLLHCRCLMWKFTEMLILVCRKVFSAFQPILHESFSNSYAFALLQKVNPFYPHLILYYWKHFCSILTVTKNISQRLLLYFSSLSQ